MSEAQLQKLVCDWCGYNGYVVIVTGQYKSSQRPVNTVGTPDLYIRKKTWPVAMWIAVELKTATGRLRLEQKILHEEGGSVVARSLEEVIDEIEQADKRLLFEV